MSALEEISAFCNGLVIKVITHVDRLVQTSLRRYSMQTIGASEAKTHLARLLDRVATGETFTITRHGVEA